VIQRLALLSLLLLPATGCGSLIEAGSRDLQDHGDHARYENKSFGEHFVDALCEPDPEPACCERSHTTVIVVEEHHRRCR
jgi:hypothetical protein